MVCRLMGDYMEPERAVEVGARIKRAIRERAGDWMRCSVGIATNRLLAKVAADMHKPDGLTLIRREELPDRLAELKLSDFPGIGPRMEERLNRAGVTTARQFIALGVEQIANIWGSRLMGGMWYHRLRGARLAIHVCWNRRRATLAMPAPSSSVSSTRPRPAYGTSNITPGRSPCPFPTSAATSGTKATASTRVRTR
jgi:nucleotidyltransferase/DNA polymerase involved in DNA repair